MKAEFIFVGFARCVVDHPAGRALNSDWSLNSFIMVVYDNLLAVLWTENILTELQKYFL